MGGAGTAMGAVAGSGCEWGVIGLQRGAAVGRSALVWNEVGQYRRMGQAKPEPDWANSL